MISGLPVAILVNTGRMSVSLGETASLEVMVPPSFLKGFGEYLCQLFGVDTAVMNGGRFFQPQLFKGKFSCDGALDLVVVAGAQVAVEIRAAVGVGQIRGGIGRRYGRNPGLPENRHASLGIAGAVGTDGRDDTRVGRQFGRCRLTAFGPAAGVLAGDFDRMAFDLTAEIIEGNFHPADRIGAQRCIRTGNNEPVTNVNGLTGAQFDNPDGICHVRLPEH